MVAQLDSQYRVGESSPLRRSLAGRIVGWLGHAIPGVIALAAVSGLVVAGQKTHWRIPKFSELRGQVVVEKDDWCAAHNVPDSECVECNKDCLPPAKERGWCKIHGVHECPVCNPAIAQIPNAGEVAAEEKPHSQDALNFAPRPENNSKCKLQQRRIQFASTEIIERLGIEVTAAKHASISESVMANGEIGFDPTRAARLSSRVSGTLWRVEKQIGDKVKKGEVLALVDAADVGKAKAELQQSIVNLDLKTQTLANLKGSTGVVAGKSVQEAEAAVAEAHVRMLAARQSLVNLGLPLPKVDDISAEPEELTRELQFLGLTNELAVVVAKSSSSSNLLPVRAPFDGEVTERSGVPGEVVAPNTVLFVVADTRTMWLTLNVRIEDAERIQVGQRVEFTHEGHHGQGATDAGTVTWVSPAVDHATRMVPIRVKLPNSNERHHAHTFGTARIVLREESRAIVVPANAVHWEGDCYVVFVRDKNFEKTKYKVFHVRKIRPGATDLAMASPQTEIAAGLLPGELVASVNSGILRSELLKNNLGAG
ncbi:MAG: efflux RND transporter periplasmic adaptor subunit [Planctomycetales bacterium]|nr:efflux RND transporter periplasmic adaptor subunit [Planctomycetales bacterium]